MSSCTSENRKPLVLVAHSGKQHAYRHATAVQRSGCLGRFVTSGYFRPDRYPDRVVSKLERIASPLRRRHHAALDSRLVSRRWGLELPEIIARSSVGNGSVADHLVFWRDLRFDRWVARRWAAAPDYDIYWGFQGSCLESLRAARRTEKLAVAEFATAHVTLAVELLTAEAERHPEWADSISNLHFPDWYRERLEQEPHEADICVVASEFSKQSLLRAGVSETRIRKLPLGADLQQFSATARSTGGPFRILFVGGVGQRKGIKYLLEAYRRIQSPNTELAIVGPLVGSGRGLAEYSGMYEYLGRLDQHAVVEQMHRSHVLVLPSVLEGFAMVIPEAMATGMPVIASTHSIAPEIVRDGADGFVLEPSDIEGLAARLDWLASHRGQAAEMGRRAALRAREFSWTAHERRVADLIRELWTLRSSSAAAPSLTSPFSFK